MNSSGQITRNELKKTVLILCSEPAFRQEISNLIALQQDLFVCGAVSRLEEAFEVVDVLWPDVVVIDMSIRLADSLQFCRICKVNYPDIALVVLLKDEDEHWFERVVDAGVSGCIVRSEAAYHIARAIRKVTAGGCYLSGHAH